MSYVFLISVVVFILIILLVKPDSKGLAATSAILINAFLSSWIAIAALRGNSYSEILYGGNVFGSIPLRLDSLSAWFVLLTNFTLLTGILYGRQYLKHCQSGPADLSLHYISYIINHAALTAIYFVQNSLAFLCSWEIMALSAFSMVIFEYGKMETLKAGINYLIQSHISIILLTLGFIWVYASTGSLDFNAIRDYCLSGSKPACLMLFLVFFIGFAIKAGFIPFHTWLPHAHPAAPSHVSGIMSGVIIKSGIYGIMRVLAIMPDNRLTIGYIILVISVISGVYGVLLAILQHNLKRLLAYHSIENIGIIGIGIGIGAIGNGLNNPYLAFAGYAGALLHTLNHSLFKSLLFYCSGNISHATHTLIIDKMGGLGRKMPHTALLFLVAALAICGLPPFNGFISEFLIYSGLFKAIGENQSASVIILAIIGLSLIGGLALLCFTKAFGIIFLGNPRHHLAPDTEEASRNTLFPLYLIFIFIAIIGLMPQIFIAILQRPVEIFTSLPDNSGYTGLVVVMQKISLAVWCFIAVAGVLFAIRYFVTKNRAQNVSPTWGCGYHTDSPRIQYTASSFVRSYAKIIKPLVITNKSKDEVSEIIPRPIQTETHFYDKIEKEWIDRPVRNLKGFLGKFKFLQNGSVQFYVLYGVVFIAISITIPLIIDAIRYLTLIIKQL